jgi:hypothetical protein
MASANSHNEALTMRRVAGAVWVLSMALSDGRASTLAKNSDEMRVATQARRKIATATKMPGSDSTTAPSACVVRPTMEFAMVSLAGRVSANWARA